MKSDEALQFGLANRVVAEGTALEAAQDLAKQISKFPQTCMRGDRLSAYQQFDLSLGDALQNEFKHGLAAIREETRAGAVRFSDGAGRHGDF